MFKLKPILKDQIWGGKRLQELYGRDNQGRNISESWEVSVHSDGESLIEGGTLAEYVSKHPESIGGDGNLSLLIKYINSAQNLSIQVHPDDEYARLNEGDNGKTEFWYIISADEGAGIYLGFKKDTDRHELLNSINEGTVEELLNYIPVKAGDCFLIEAGTVHAICEGCVICEIQQSSNVTYRLYDYGRKGADGKPRTLHIEKALDVINYNKFTDRTNSGKKLNISGGIMQILTECKYFVCKRLELDGEYFETNEGSFTAVNIISGEGKINGEKFVSGDSFFLPCGEKIKICGRAVAILTSKNEEIFKSSYDLSWFGEIEDSGERFPVNIPGDIQKDYAAYKHFPDHNIGLNFKLFDAVEDSTWVYSCEFSYKKSDKQTFFVTDGIDYECEIFLNDEKLFYHEGMFEGFEVDLTDRLINGTNILKVRILPPPKCRELNECRCARAQAAESVKPPASYQWDWHPRLIPSGIWNGAHIEDRDGGYLGDVEVKYTLADDYSFAKIYYTAQSKLQTALKLFDADGNEIGYTEGGEIMIDAPMLWWCNGQGEPYLYSYEISNGVNTKRGRIGLRRVSLSMNGDAWKEPSKFPKSRSNPPITMTLNGRKIFCKGSNFVEPDIFTGNITDSHYENLVRLAKEANMNIFRMWGGGGLQKEIFYSLCDEYGIMVWQEFPLACNAYPDKQEYLDVLESEACAIVKKMRRHPSTVLYCGGNELFNSWSRMTDQSHALRLLNAVCYELDRNIPFLMTSPVMGMAHGGYRFYIPGLGDAYEIFNNSSNTAYTEFGIPSFTDYEILKECIPEDELKFPTNNELWREHHAFPIPNLGGGWAQLEILQHYFPHISTTEECCYYSTWLQCEGYKAIFEEARRQKPCCSMAINWCYNEPWRSYANCAILMYPCKPKKSYYAIKDSLREVCPSARINKFDYAGNEIFTAELWMLNDSPREARDNINVYIEIENQKHYIMKWENIFCPANENTKGHILQFRLPADADTDHFTLILESESHGSSEYKLRYRPTVKQIKQKLLNE